jgi:hypothetical protein
MMDIQHLIDRLEDLIDEGKHIPMGRYTLIDEERALSIIDQMRISIPEQVEAANRVIMQRDKLMAQANEEANRLVDYAKQKSAELLDKDMITVSARHQSENILAQAYVEGDRIRAEADAYVVEVLRDLESHLLRTLTVVRNGIAKVMQDREASQQARANAAAAHATPAEAPATLTLPKREEVLVER